ncbi:hypothetical protein QFC19_002930 [Naganishia cerealis]|uniref:Uncharacterized protein n=1 Tax=Naganishia cerealis TaxID=610337 RepID=A0ACC2W6W9_9TREE|nr:hypothetical protein QFC19_002930 [Naganishia cerealis]
MSARQHKKFPAVYHPTISEYYRLSLRLEDYLRCVIAEEDWQAVFDRGHAPFGEAETFHNYQQLLSGVLVAFPETQAAALEQSWDTSSIGQRVGPRMQSQADVGILLLMVPRQD